MGFLFALILVAVLFGWGAAWLVLKWAVLLWIGLMVAVFVLAAATADRP